MKVFPSSSVGIGFSWYCLEYWCTTYISNTIHGASVLHLSVIPYMVVPSVAPAVCCDAFVSNSVSRDAHFST